MKFLADENFDRPLLKQLKRRLPNLDVITIQELQFTGMPDERILEWCAEHERIILTHDIQTMVGFAYDRVEAGLPMPGLFLIPTLLPVGKALEELEYIFGASFEGEYEGQVVFIG